MNMLLPRYFTIVIFMMKNADLADYDIISSVDFDFSMMALPTRIQTPDEFRNMSRRYAKIKRLRAEIHQSSHSG